MQSGLSATGKTRGAEIETLIARVNILEFLHALDNPARAVSAKDKGMREETRHVARCPFHAAGTDEFLEVLSGANRVTCSWCDKTWDPLEYLRDLRRGSEEEAFAQLTAYVEKTTPAPAWEIITPNRHETVVRVAGGQVTTGPRQRPEIIGPREYRITGLNVKRLGDYAFTLKLETPASEGRPGRFVILEVNLSRPKSRQEFVDEVRQTLFLGEEVIREDLQLLAAAVEKLQRDNIERREAEGESERKVFIMTESEEKQAMDLLSSRDVLTEDLFADTEKLGYVGDELGKQVLYLAATSRLLRNPVSVLSVANSSAGKSFAQESILSLLPCDAQFDFTRISPKSMGYFGKNALSHKVMCSDELSGIEEEAMYQVRSMLSKGLLTIGFAGVDKESGRHETLAKEVHGPVAVFSSTTHEELIDDETKSRFIVLRVDESAEQTGRVFSSMLERQTKRAMLADAERAAVRRKYQVLQKALRPVQVLIPDEWVGKLSFYSRRISFKRHFKTYLSLLTTVALHRQYQKQVRTEKDSKGRRFDYIYADERDLSAANRLVQELFGDYKSSLNPVNRKLLEDIERFCQARLKGTTLKLYEVLFCRREIREYCGWEHRPLRRAFEALLEMEYLTRVFGADRTRHLYRLAVDESQAELFDLGLWSPSP